MKYLATLAGFGLALLIGSVFLFAQAHNIGEHKTVTNGEYCNLEKYPSHEEDESCGNLVEIPFVIHDIKNNQESSTEPNQPHQVVKVQPSNDESCGN